jgi:hypothetical protein
MTANLIEEAEDDLDRAFDIYQDRQQELGLEIVEEFRKGVDAYWNFQMRGSRWTKLTVAIGFIDSHTESCTE